MYDIVSWSVTYLRRVIALKQVALYTNITSFSSYADPNKLEHMWCYNLLRSLCVCAKLSKGTSHRSGWNRAVLIYSLLLWVIFNEKLSEGLDRVIWSARAWGNANISDMNTCRIGPKHTCMGQSNMRTFPSPTSRVLAKGLELLFDPNKLGLARLSGPPWGRLPLPPLQR